MPRGAPEVADVFRRYGDAYRQQHGTSLSTAQRRVMTAIDQFAELDAHNWQSSGVAQQPSAATSSNAMPAATNASVTTRAAIVTAQSASSWPAPSGWRTADPNS